MLKILIPILFLALIQQWYARTSESGVEQPIGILGITEYLFRHPETLIGLRFNYPVLNGSRYGSIKEMNKHTVIGKII